MTRLANSPALVTKALLASAWVATALALVAWLWLSWGLFNGSSWNDIRLAPVFGLKLGLPLYNGSAGLPHTWMYGPLPVWIMWPATWAGDPATALGVAGFLNIGVTLGPIVLVCALTPLPSKLDQPAARWAAAMVAMALWPGASWRFIQADNLAIACGLLGNLAMMRSQKSAAAWIAAAGAAAGLACKQTALAVPLAQLIWLGWLHGPRAAGRHLVRLTACAGLVGLAICATEDPTNVWFALVTVPGGLPGAEDPWRRFIDVAPDLAVQLALPAVVSFWIHRSGPGRMVALPVLSWLLAIPPGLAALFTYGGNINSLQGLGLWLPAGASLGTALCLSRRPGIRPLLTILLLTTGLFVTRIAVTPAHRWDFNRQRYTEAKLITDRFPDKVWFPWHPLVTIYSESRRYADEDGLAVRALAGHPLPRSVLAAYLPPEMSAIALPAGTPHWGVAQELRPEEDYTTVIAGEWRMDIWETDSPGP